MNVARASLEELLLDYQDFRRVRDLPQWDKNSREASYVRKLGAQADESFETYRPFFADRPPEVLANIAIWGCLWFGIHRGMGGRKKNSIA